MFESITLPKSGRRPAHTLLFITEVKTFRVDADRKGLLVGNVSIIEHGCKAPANLAKAFNRIAENTNPLGRKVWLLFLRLPCFLINLPTMQVRGIDDAMLAQALQFEAEGMTGVSSAATMMAFQFLREEHEMSDYWAVQIDRLVWSDLLKSLKQYKSQLAGLLHPSALPVSIHSPQAPEWLRIEAWSTMLVALHRNESRLSIQSLSFDNNHWQVELDQWLEEQGPIQVSEALLNNKVEMLPTTAQQFSLNEEAHLEQWLGLWARTLSVQRQPEVAVLKPVASINPDWLWMAGSGLAALLLCGLHAGWFIYQRHHLESETGRLTQVQKAMSELSKQFSESSDQKDKLERIFSKIETNADLIPNTVKMLQQRPALLLQALANGRHDELIVETIDSQLHNVTVGGVILQLNLGSKLASYLDHTLKDAHWQVVETPIENLKLFDGEPGPWSFKMKLDDKGLPGFNDP